MCSWDTRQMYFGAGTKLIVEARNQPLAKPSVFIMKNETKVACLVKDFYPKDIQISLSTSKKIKEFNPAIVVSPSGKYSAVKLGHYTDSSSVTCTVEQNGETLNATVSEPKATHKEKPSSSPAPDHHTEPMDPANKENYSESCSVPKAVHIEKVNMMSLTVLGLRVVFVKSVAVNFLLTAKLFFF